MKIDNICCWLFDSKMNIMSIRTRCKAIIIQGRQCSFRSMKNSEFCNKHGNKELIKCIALKPGGDKCLSPPSKGSAYCHNHDSEKKSEYRCGAPKVRQGKCRRKVSRKGMLCHFHRSQNIKETKGSKICSVCDTPKELDEFYYSYGGKYCRVSACKQCTKKIAKNKYKNSAKHSRKKSGNKLCSGCGIEKYVSKFTTDTANADGLHISCRTCKNTDDCKRLSENVQTFVHYLFESVTNDSKRGKHLEVTIDEQFIINKYDEQKGICIKTGMKMTHKRVYDPDRIGVDQNSYHNISIDRVNSCIGYIDDNVQVTNWGYNRMKMDMVEDDFIIWCRKVARYDRSGRPLPKHNAQLTRRSTAFIKERFNTLLNRPQRSKREKIKVTFTLEDLLNKYKDSKGICYYTGEKLTMIHRTRGDGDYCSKVKENYSNYSVDRTESTDDYSLDNIQQVCGIINNMKGEMTEETFIKFCEAIADHNPLV